MLVLDNYLKLFLLTSYLKAHTNTAKKIPEKEHSLYVVDKRFKPAVQNEQGLIHYN